MGKVILKKIGKSIKNLRQKKGISQEKLAEHVGMSRNAISLIERGISNTSTITLDKILHALDINFSTYFENFL